MAENELRTSLMNGLVELHIDKRKVELGGCARPYGTGCQHEHACFSEITDQPIPASSERTLMPNTGWF
ncbi:hypothetical protein [Nocardia lijiangensis]|uniref:hypothetical protein n=1 Tax=Nocardia lijiangensis TaxID=299618 RepID=UPI000A02A579|nr:hypothetical protein [Nocardia lijiangensis]